MDIHSKAELGFYRKGRCLMADFLLLTLIGCLSAAQAATYVAPSPPAGRQAKLEAEIWLSGFGANRHIDRVRVVNQGSGYDESNPPPVLAFSAQGSGADYIASVYSYSSGVSYVSSNLDNFPASLGAGYSDDLTLVIPPPHTNDFQGALDAPGIDVIELQRGVYYQNAVINRNLTIRGQGIGKTIISGGLLDSVFKINQGVFVRLEDLTIIDGLAENGGGIYNDGGFLTVERCEIKNCRAYGVAGEGGGIYNRSTGRLSIIDSRIHNNASARNGGGISNSGINTSILPAVAGSGQSAASTIQQFFTDLFNVSPPADDTPPEQGFNASVDAIDAVVGDFVGLFKDLAEDVRPTFQSLGADPFDPNIGWEGSGMPSTIIRNSEITNNRTGVGIAAAKTSLIVSEPIIVGQNCTPLGVCIPIIGGFRTTTIHPKDIRFAGFGGGIHNDLGLLVIENSTLTNNEVDTRLGAMGGAVSSFFGVVRVRDSKLNGNRVYSTTVLPTGGAVHSFASWVDVADSELNNNVAPVGLFLSSGGAVKSTALSFVNLERCDIIGNTSGGGGGVANDYLAFLNINDSTITNNSVTGIIGAYGGGVRNENGGHMKICNSTISGNSAKGKAKGGGIYNHCEPLVEVVAGAPLPIIALSTATLQNTTISGNTVDGKGTFGIPLEALGAGVYNGSSGKDIKIGGDKFPVIAVANLNLYSSTIYGNTAHEGIIHTGGGLYNTAISNIKINPLNTRPGVSVVQIANNLFAANTPNDLLNVSFSPAVINSLGYNLDSDGSGSQAAALSELLLSSDKRFITASDPMLAPLGHNGGPTFTHALEPLSPAKDKGSPNGVLDATAAPAGDQRGLDRSLGGRRDIGALESLPPVGFPDEFDAAGGYLVLEDATFSVDAPGLLENDFGDNQKARLVSDAAHGSVIVAPDGGFTYTPDPNYTGPDSFTYQGVDVFDRAGSPVTVSLAVQSRLDLIATSPAANAVVSPTARSFVLTFDETVNAADVERNVSLSGSLSGPLPISVPTGSASNAVTVNAGRDFQPGETLSLTVRDDLQSVAGSPLFPSFVVRFQVGTETGEGFFALGGSLPGAGSKALLIDMDNDGDLDVVGGNEDDSVWRNEGQLVFTPTGQSLAAPGPFSFSSTRPISAIAAGDVNDDGLVDIVVVTNDSTGRNSVWLNGGSGLFSVDSEVGGNARDVVMGDLNHDGFPDLVLTSNSGARVYLNDGRGRFAQSQHLAGSSRSKSAALADLNGDGRLDLFLVKDGVVDSGASTYDPNLVFLYNAVTARFDDSGQMLGSGNSQAVALGDVNGDGTVDAVVANDGDSSRLQIWLNDGSGQFASGGDAESSASDVALLDIEGDGDPDILTASLSGSRLWINDGAGSFAEDQTLGSSGGNLSVGDIDGDGDVDALLANGSTQIWLNSSQPMARDQNYILQEDNVLTVPVSQGVASGASSLNGYPVTAHLGIIVHRAPLNTLWIRFGFGTGYDYEGVWPNGSYVHRTLSQPEHGSLVFNDDGSFTYTPDQDFLGTDSFTYYLEDGPLRTPDATVVITVTPHPDAPIANDDFYPHVAFDGHRTYSLVQQAPGVLANDRDPDLGTLTATLETAPVEGTVVLNGDGSFEYEYASGVRPLVVDEFTYRVSNGSLSRGPVVVKLGRFPINAADDLYTPAPGTSFSVDANSGVLTNDTDLNLARFPNSILTARLKSGPAFGTLVFNEDGSFAYTPNSGYLGSDSFFYVARTISQDLGVIQQSALTRVKLGNTPIAVDDGPYTALEGNPLVIGASEGVLANDSDVLTPMVVTPPASGTVTLAADGSFSYTPNAGFNGDDFFTYLLTDGTVSSTEATVTLRSVNRFRVVAVTPAQNAVRASANTNIQLMFNGDVDAATIGNRLVVWGSQTGERGFSANVSGPTVTLNPTVDFLPGEKVSVTAVAGIRSTGFLDLVQGFVWSFQVESPRGGRTNFVRTEPSSTPHQGDSVALGDLNGDGLPDAVINNWSELPTVMINNGNRTFTDRVETLGFDSHAGGSETDALLADFDGDGDLDVLSRGTIANSTRTHVGLNDGTGQFPTIRVAANDGTGSLNPGSHVEAADFDGDGDLDILGVSISKAWLWENDGAATFTYNPASDVPLAHHSRDGVSGDIDNDGDLDVYLVGFDGGELLINNGDGTFTATTEGVDTGSASAVALADLDDDGFLDALVATSRVNDWDRVWFNNGSGRFVRGNQTLLAQGAIESQDVALGDLDGDGFLDLWQAIPKNGAGTGGGDAVWFNQGNGRFDLQDPLLGSSTSRGVALADLDQDGDLDAFVANRDNAGSSAVPAIHEVWFNEAPPTAVDDFYPANGSNAVTVSSPGVLTNDLAGDGTSLHAAIATQPAHGFVSLSASGSFTFTPSSTFAGTDAFTYRAQDSLGSALARVKIGNAAPVAVDDQFRVAAETTNTVKAPGVFGNDTNPDGDPLTAVLVASTSNGALTLNADGSFAYTPSSGYVGPDSFTYRASDGVVSSSVATVSLDVRNALSIVKYTPRPNAVSISAAEDLQIRFDRPVNPATVSDNVGIIGNQSGVFAYSSAVVDETLILNPSADFLPGEEITLVLSNGLQGDGGEQLLQPVLVQFIAEAPTGEGVFTDSGQRLGDGGPGAFDSRVGDLDGDGDVDLFVVWGGTLTGVSPNVTVVPGFGQVWLNNGAGVYTKTNQEIGKNPHRAALGDVDDDGDLDVVLGDHTLWLNDGAGGFSNSGQVFGTDDDSVQLIELVDLDEDGDLDVIRMAGSTLYVFLNDGTGSFTANPASTAELSFTGLLIESVVVGDVNGDGTVDIVVRQLSSSPGHHVWLNDGGAVFRDSGLRFGNGGRGLAMGDLDGDGDLDIFSPYEVPNFSTTIASFVWLNDGTGVFTDSGQLYPQAEDLFVRDVELADVDGDGDLDGIVAQSSDFAADATRLSTIYENDGSGIFSDALIPFGSLGQNSAGGDVSEDDIAIADVNGDGALDIFILGRTPDQVWFNGAVLAPLAGLAGTTITDKESTQPFANVLVRGAGSSALDVSVAIDDVAKGDFTSASVSAAGFSGTAGGPYHYAATTAADAQDALRALVFAPVENRVALGLSEINTFTIEISDGTTTRIANPTLTVVSVNDPPMAVDDSGTGFTTAEGVAFTTDNVLDNDTDPDPADTLSLVEIDDSVTLGTVVNLNDGTFSYDPGNQFDAIPLGQTATDSFRYLMQDAGGLVSAAEVVVTIEGRNASPVAIPDALTVDESVTALVIANAMIVNDEDADVGDKLGLYVSAIETNGTLGTVQLLSGDVVTYLANGNLAPGATSTDTFRYSVADANGGVSAPAEVSITIVGQADPPTAGADVLSIDENAPAADITNLVLSNDMDPDPGQAGTLVVTEVDTAGTIGTVLLDAGVLTYDPDFRFESLPAGSSVTDSFDYTVTDVDGLTASATVVVTVMGQNDPPYAIVDYPVVEEGAPDADITDELLPNDIDQDAGEQANLRIIAVETTGTGGTVTLAGQRVSYRPDPGLQLGRNEVVTDTFLYTVEDPHGATGEGLVTVSVAGINSTPVANPASFSVAEDETLSDTVTASDTDGDSLTFAVVNFPTEGTLAMADDGTFTYTPAAHFNGPDAFTFAASDANETSNEATVMITVTPVNDAPVADNASFSVDEDQTLSDAVTASDIDGGSLTFTTSTPPANGALALAADGTFTYTPNQNFNGADSFAFTADDADGPSNIATVDITVNAEDDAPVADAAQFTVAEDQTLNGAVTASDVDGDSLTFATASVPANGSLVFETSGTFTYTPNKNFNGADSFTFTASDANASSLPATVNLTVTAVNDAPTIVSIGNQTVNELQSLTFNATAMDVDLPGDVLTFSLSDGLNGAVPPGAIISSSGAFEWTPTEQQGPGEFMFDVVVTDNGTPPESTFETIIVTVDDVNVDPVLASIGPQSVDELATLSFTASATDSDFPQQSLSFGLDAAAINAGMTLDPTTGEFSFTPTESQGGTIIDATITVTDGGGLTDFETVAITVNEVNVVPVVVDAEVSIDEVAPVFTPVHQVVASDSDIPSNTLGYAITDGNVGGAFAIDSVTGEITVAASAPLDFETMPQFVLEVTVTDDGAPPLSGVGFITVNLRDQVEAFSESGGLLVIEAENYDFNTAQGAHQWVERNHKPDYLGDGFLCAEPNIGARIKDSRAEQLSPKLTYRVEFTEIGEYFVWVRGLGESGSDNSVYIGLDGEVEDGEVSFEDNGLWDWDDPGDSIEITTPGVHEICVWMREDGTYIDRLLLTKDKDFDPNDEAELPESSRDGEAFNTPPSVAIVSPVNQTVFETGDTVTIEVDALDPDGTVTSVEVLVDGASLGVLTPPDTTIDFIPLLEDLYDLTAVATDNDGAQTTSALVKIKVGSAAPAQPFAEQGGLVVIEAESFEINMGAGGHDWVERDNKAGFEGSTALRAEPNNGTRHGNKRDALTLSPKLSYLVEFQTIGNYEFWVRGLGENGSDNSVWVGIDGAVQQQVSFSDDDEWDWRSKNVRVETPGLHELCIWMREDGTYIDRLLLSAKGDDDFDPEDDGPLPESPRVPTVAPQLSSSFIANSVPIAAGTELSYAAWHEQTLGGAEVISEVGDDPDRDGLSNLEEYAFGLNPLRPDSGNLLVGRWNEGGQLEFVYDYAARAVEATVTIEGSSDLLEWHVIGNAERSNSEMNRHGQVETTYQMDPETLWQKPYYRLRVTQTPATRR